MLEQTRFGTRRTIHRQFDDVVESMKRALADQAFHVVSEVDLGSQAGMDEGRKYKVLSAWNALASRALQRDPEMGSLLPCNVVIYENGGTCIVSAVDPFCALEVVGPDSLVEEAVIDSREKLHRAIESV